MVWPRNFARVIALFTSSRFVSKSRRRITLITIRSTQVAWSTLLRVLRLLLVLLASPAAPGIAPIVTIDFNLLFSKHRFTNFNLFLPLNTWSPSRQSLFNISTNNSPSPTSNNFPSFLSQAERQIISQNPSRKYPITYRKSCWHEAVCSPVGGFLPFIRTRLWGVVNSDTVWLC